MEGSQDLLMLTPQEVLVAITKPVAAAAAAAAAPTGAEPGALSRGRAARRPPQQEARSPAAQSEASRCSAGFGLNLV